MKHLFEQGTNPEAPVLVLFHGTGGSEYDLIPTAKQISPGSSILSLRGAVLENGMPRFFRRLAEGVFDEEDLIFRTREMQAFLDQAAEDYQLRRDQFVALGYSNGANLVGSLLFHFGQSLRGAILHHPMVPLRGLQLPDLEGVPVFIGAGRNDPISPVRETAELQSLLEGAGADVFVHWGYWGHQLSEAEIAAAKIWFESRIACVPSAGEGSLGWPS